jgi:hypothetical protein
VLRFDSRDVEVVEEEGGEDDLLARLKQEFNAEEIS